MGKNKYIQAIFNYLDGLSEYDFQKAIMTILNISYKHLGKDFEEVSSDGGDSGNDGWIKEDNIFFAMYSPKNFKSSYKNELLQKFKSDLTNLCKNVYEEKKWGGFINEFIFMANLRKDTYPSDPLLEYDNHVKELEKKYSVNIKHQRVSSKYLWEIFNKIDDESLYGYIVNILNIGEQVDTLTLKSSDLVKIIELIAENKSDNDEVDLSESLNDFKVISAQEKIKINDLNFKEKRVLRIIANLNIVEEALKVINNNPILSSAFEGFKNYIVKLYKNNKDILHANELYEFILSEATGYVSHKDSKILKDYVEYYIVEIFEKCDIFEKVGNKK